MVKRLLSLFIISVCLSCSSEDDSSQNITPESYNIKYEVLGTGMAYEIGYSEGYGYEEVVRKKYVNLPFTKEFSFKTEIEGEDNTYGYVTMHLDAYDFGDEEVGEVQEIRIFIDGELVCADTDGPSNNSDNTLSRWTCSYKYLRRDL